MAAAAVERDEPPLCWATKQNKARIVDAKTNHKRLSVVDLLLTAFDRQQ